MEIFLFCIGVLFILGTMSYSKNDEDVIKAITCAVIALIICCGVSLKFGINIGTDDAVQVNMEQVPVKGEVTILITETVTFKDGKRVQINMLNQKVVGK